MDDFWGHVRHSRLILAVGAAALGAAIVLLAIGHGVLDSSLRAAWWSALATVFAGVVALALGVEANLRAERAAKATAAGVAALVSLPLYHLRATLEILQANNERLRADKERHAAWLHANVSKWFAESKPIIQDRHLPLLTSLPPEELQFLVLADDALERFKAKHLLPTTATVAQVLAAFDTFMDKALAMLPLVIETSNQIHRLSPNDGNLAPWDAAALRRDAAKPPEGAP